MEKTTYPECSYPGSSSTSSGSTRGSSRSRSASPAGSARSRSGSAGSARSRSGSSGGSQPSPRSRSPVIRRSTSGSPASYRSRSRSPGSHSGRSGSPRSHRYRSGSPWSHRSRSRSPQSHRNRSGSPWSHRSRSGSPWSQRRRSGSRSRSGLRSSCSRSRSRSGSRSSASRSRSRSRSGSRSRSPSPGVSAVVSPGGGVPSRHTAGGSAGYRWSAQQGDGAGSSRNNSSFQPRPENPAAHYHPWGYYPPGYGHQMGPPLVSSGPPLPQQTVTGAFQGFQGPVGALAIYWLTRPIGLQVLQHPGVGGFIYRPSGQQHPGVGGFGAPQPPNHQLHHYIPSRQGPLHFNMEAALRRGGGDDGLRQYMSDQHGQEVVWPGFRALYQDEKLFDTTLVAEGQSFKVHRCYLASCSQYFHSMFTGGFSESKEGTVVMKGVTARGLQAAIQYMYTGTVELQHSSITAVLEAASLLQLWGLRKFCEEYLREKLSVDSCLRYLYVSEMYSLETVKNIIVKFILSHFVEIGQRDEFLTISAELMCEVLADEKLEAESELQVFNIALRWLKHEPERSYHTAKVLGYIRFGLMTAQEMELIHNNLIKDKTILTHCEDILHLAMKYHMNIFRQPLMNIPMAQPRMFVESLALFGGISTGSVIRNTVYASAVHVDAKEVVHFETITELKKPLHFAEVVILNNFVFVVGGERALESDRGKVATTAVYRYNTRDGKWLQLASMSKPRARFVLAALDNCLLVVGGICGNKLSASVQKYNLEENEWTDNVPNLPFPVAHHAGCVLNGCVYISGGSKGQVLNQLHKFNFAEGKWEKKSSMHHKRTWHCMVSNRDQLFVCGGMVKTGGPMWPMAGVTQTEMYDAQNNQWSLVAPVLKHVYHARAVRCSNCIFIMGGNMGNGYLRHHSDTIQCYDIDKDEWSVLTTKLPVALAGAAAGCVRIPQRFYQYNAPD